MTPKKIKLNKEQHEAVTTTEGYLRVIAGAGTGKTRVLVNRYAYLIKDLNIDPRNILCVTFTNKAAKEMRERIKRIVGEGYETTLICTYHSLAARLIRENASRLLMAKNFQILDNAAQRRILRELFSKYECRADQASFGEILNIITKDKSIWGTSYVRKMCTPSYRNTSRFFNEIGQKNYKKILLKNYNY